MTLPTPDPRDGSERPTFFAALGLLNLIRAELFGNESTRSGLVHGEADRLLLAQHLNDLQELLAAAAPLTPEPGGPKS